ncbi:MAG: ribosome biogenesis GTP-binding protein YihA/YsxC [Acidimicrobiales bacterium]
MSGPLQLRFVTSAAKHGQLGESIVEIAVAGRSNVGKSSLLNALANRKSLAKTSKTPGATRLLNVFELDPEGSGKWLVDLPGYGYAKAPKHEQERWARMIENYLTERETLDLVLMLVDGAVGPTALDLQSLDWFEHIGVPVRIIATKHDKVKPSMLGARKAELAKHCGVDLSDVQWVSAAKGTGIPELRNEIHRLLDEV